MSTRGASGLALQRPWQIMGALEAVDGMLLFGVSTVMQVYWSMLTAHVTPSKKLTREFRELRSQTLLHLLTTGFGTKRNCSGPSLSCLESGNSGQGSESARAGSGGPPLTQVGHELRDPSTSGQVRAGLSAFADIASAVSH